MPFPRAPKTPVTGQLKLLIKSPTQVQVVSADPRDEFSGRPDFSDKLSFKLPRGFTKLESPTNFITEQETKALELVRSLQKKAKACASCHKEASILLLYDVSEVITISCSYLKSNAKGPVKIIVGPLVANTSTLRFIGADKEIGVIVSPQGVEVGKYYKNTLIKDSGLLLGFPDINNWFEWLVEE